MAEKKKEGEQVEAAARESSEEEWSRQKSELEKQNDERRARLGHDQPDAQTVAQMEQEEAQQEELSEEEKLRSGQS